MGFEPTHGLSSRDALKVTHLVFLSAFPQTCFLFLGEFDIEAPPVVHTADRDVQRVGNFFNDFPRLRFPSLTLFLGFGHTGLILPETNTRVQKECPVPDSNRRLQGEVLGS